MTKAQRSEVLWNGQQEDEVTAAGPAYRWATTTTGQDKESRAQGAGEAHREEVPQSQMAVECIIVVIRSLRIRNTTCARRRTCKDHRVVRT